MQCGASSPEVCYFSGVYFVRCSEARVSTNFRANAVHCQDNDIYLLEGFLHIIMGFPMVFNQATCIVASLPWSVHHAVCRPFVTRAVNWDLSLQIYVWRFSFYTSVQCHTAFGKMQCSLLIAAVQRCLVTANLHAEWFRTAAQSNKACSLP